MPEAYTKKIDVYAAGIILYQMLVGYHPLYISKPPFDDSFATLRMKIGGIEPELWHYPAYVTDHARDLICRMCRISQIERYDVRKALGHPWITRRFDD